MSESQTADLALMRELNERIVLNLIVTFNLFHISYFLSGGNRSTGPRSS